MPINGCAPVAQVTWGHVLLALIGSSQVVVVAWLARQNRRQHGKVMDAVERQDGR